MELKNVAEIIQERLTTGGYLVKLREGEGCVYLEVYYSREFLWKDGIKFANFNVRIFTREEWEKISSRPPRGFYFLEDAPAEEIKARADIFMEKIAPCRRLLDEIGEECKTRGWLLRRMDRSKTMDMRRIVRSAYVFLYPKVSEFVKFFSNYRAKESSVPEDCQCVTITGRENLKNRLQIFELLLDLVRQPAWGEMKKRGDKQDSEFEESLEDEPGEVCGSPRGDGANVDPL